MGVTANSQVFKLQPPAGPHVIAGPTVRGGTTLAAGQRLVQAEREARTAAALLEILARVETSERLEDGCAILADEFQRLACCDRVALGCCGRQSGCFPLLTVSGMPRIDRRLDVARRLEAALAETMLSGDGIAWPPDEHSPSQPTLAHQRLAAAAKAGWIISSPLRDSSGAVLAAWLFLGPGETERRADATNLMRAGAPRVAACLGLLKRAEVGPISRWTRKLLVGKHARWRWLAASAVLAAIAMSFLPAANRIQCKCKVQPVVRRFVSAPFEGTLEKSLAEPGDVVCQGQTLARMDGREIRWETSALWADHNRAEVKRNVSMAKHETGASRMAELEAQRLALKLHVLDARSEHLQIKSPLRGVLLVGDQKRAEGMSVAVGQALFEVAPLDRMVVEIAVPERDLQQVAVGMDAIVRLDACRGTTCQAAIEKLNPRAETIDGEHVFVAELAIDNPGELLRPGMNGTATVLGRVHPWIWNVSHKLWENMAALCGW
jgi:multidrug efflux pump subunit AcrA (membrane-fusion protein)